MLIIGIILFDAFGWKLFKFKFCSSPQEIRIIELTVQKNVCHIKAESAYIGSFFNARYNGVIFTYDNGVLKIGMHEGIINSDDIIDDNIKVNGEIKKVILCGKEKEQEVDEVKDFLSSMSLEKVSVSIVEEE